MTDERETIDRWAIWNGEYTREEVFADDFPMKKGTVITLREDEFEEWSKRKMALPGYVCLGMQEGEAGFVGLVEHSFSLGTDPNRTQFFWTGPAVSNLGTHHDIDGLEDAKYRVSKHPELDIEIYDARDAEALPVELDWYSWLIDSLPAYTLAGVNNKFGARNLRFRFKD